MYYVLAVIGGCLVGIVATRLFYASALSKLRTAESWAKGELVHMPEWIAAKWTSLGKKI
jgi:hypothetical protein